MEGNKEEMFRALPIERPKRIHRVLAYSYSFYFFLFVCSVTLDYLFPFQIFEGNFWEPFGFILLAFGSILIIWAQVSSRKLDKSNPQDVNSKHIFFHGPYKFSRSPTHWGLFLLILGFGVMADALFVILFTMIAFVVTRLTFVEKQEKILAQKYGDPYLEYKKTVNL